MIKPLNDKAQKLIGTAATEAEAEPERSATPLQPMLMPERDLSAHQPEASGPASGAPDAGDPEHLVSGYAFNECCPAFAPGWEVDQFDAVDPCPWQTDLALCYSTCFWTAQVPDNLAGSPSGDPRWLDRCGNIQNDWRNLCVIPDTR